MASPILFSFVNTRLKDSYGERGLVISSMMTFGFCTQIWVPLFTFPTVDAPRWRNGYPAALVFIIAMWSILMFGISYMARWKLRHPDAETVIEVEDTEGRSWPSSDEIEEEKDSYSTSTPGTPSETQAVLTLVATREQK